MIIGNFNIFGCARRPTEANAKLIVDAHAPLPGTVARKLFQSIRGRGAHILDAPRQIELLELAQCGPFNIDESPHATQSEQGFDSGVLERLDHGTILTCHVSIVQIGILRCAVAFSAPCSLHYPVALNEKGEKLSKQTMAAPLDTARPLPALVQALSFLRQEVSKELAEGSIEDFWRWAVGNWEVKGVPRVAGVKQENLLLGRFKS